MSTRIKKQRSHVLISAAAVVVATVLVGRSARSQTVSVDDTQEGTLVTPAVVPTGPVDDAGAERFVPKSRITAVGMLEMRHDVVITGPEVRLRQVCRWSQDQAASFVPIADLVIDRLPSKRPKKFTLDDVRSTLRDAGVNQGLIQFTGYTSCLVSCADTEADTPADNRSALDQWIDQSIKRNDADTAAPTSNLPKTATSPAAVAINDVASADEFHTLRDLLLTDLSQRLNLPPEQLQLTIDPKDTNLLNLSEPTFHFELEPRRVRDLGRVSWDVSILTGRSTQKVTINGEARAWEKQLVIAKPANYRQVIREDDVTERRVLMDHIDEDPVLNRSQVIGQEASRDLKPGTVMTARLVESVPLAKQGQYISVKLIQGGIQIQTVAKALEAGSFGQTIKVKNEESNETYSVTLTGPQTGVMGPAPQ